MKRAGALLVICIGAIAIVCGIAIGRWLEAQTVTEFRDWVSALSGYFAALGAAVAAWLTIGPLKDQVRTAQSQTDFLLGDADPEFVVTRKFGARRLRLRITNWNRRSIAIDRINATSGGDPMEIEVMANPDDRHVPPQKLRRIHLSGWADRNGPPAVKNVYFHAPEMIGGDGADPLRREVCMRVSYRILGKAHEERQEVARAIDLT